MNKKPSNWIQGLSVQERKKQGIITVNPPKKIDKKIHYNVGHVDVQVDYSHMNKLRVLHMTMHNWEKNNGEVPMDSRMGRMYESDLHKVEELVERGTETMLESDTEFLGTDQFLTKDEMLEMNDLYKTYGGKRVTQ